MPYAIANVRCENGPTENHLRIGWYRSVYNIPHAFAVCSFADELAAAAGTDPVEYLRALLGGPRMIDLKAIGVDYPNYGASIDEYPIDTGRMRAVLDLAVKNSGWGAPLAPAPRPGGRGASQLPQLRGGGRRSGGRRNEGNHGAADRLAVDCGLVVNPDRVHAQMEGAAIMGRATRSTAISA